jgi:hypothetical protein
MAEGEAIQEAAREVARMVARTAPTMAALSPEVLRKAIQQAKLARSEDRTLGPLQKVCPESS